PRSTNGFPGISAAWSLSRRGTVRRNLRREARSVTLAAVGDRVCAGRYTVLDSAYRGTRVLELAAGLSAGVAGRFFADLGAEVIRVEYPETPPHNAAEEALLDWTRLHKGTLRTATGGAPAVAALERLAAGADLVITDLAPARRPGELPAPEA